MDGDSLFEEFLRWRKTREAEQSQSKTALAAEAEAPSPIAKQHAPLTHGEESTRTTKDLLSDFDDDEGVPLASFVSWAPRRPSPFGLSWEQLKNARTRAVAALIILVALSVLFAIVGTQTFWAARITWQAWYTLFVIIIMLSCLVLDLWDVSLTFFVANTALLLARVITLADALAGFSN